jgi:hypothetical protein
MTEAAASHALVQCEQGAAAIAAAVAPLLANPVRARTQGLAGQAYAHQVHAWEALARVTMRIYSEGALQR